MDEHDIFRALLAAQDQGLEVALCTVIRTTGSMPRHAGSKMLVYPDGKIIGTIGGGGMESRVIGDAQAVIKSGKARLESYTLNDPQRGDPGVCGGTADIFIESVGLPPTLVVIGCGHVGKALAELGKWLKFRVVVSDDRAELCTPEHLPGMDQYLVCAPEDLSKHLKITPHTYVAAVTRGQLVDEKLLPPLLESDAPYIGLIGSRRRWALTTKALQEQGMSTDQLKRVHAPIGLELNAETPQEIALSIMAEVIMRYRGGTGQPMQWLENLKIK
ncbi:MAG: XdhC family protein [Anaerolinea sp.]|nr:XdhC family protein [Anaerolinea sp.]MCC6974939.1 XdhC family protein [Anaerolineae bacterium]CAG0987185.1 putative xanthine dehydrogenase subunit A [Anaerolineae bacterium]